jgi:AraC family transcriptional regulator, regulatory protein of adaptative response / methylated-DNA-[protein]-cysteine methyltransferase
MLMPDTSPAPAALEDPRWTAVAARDRRADGAFVYAVHSTGIYCRPSCPSRRPRPDRVKYFAAGAEAAAAGYRACRRCDPDGAAPGPVARKVAAALALLERAEPGHTPSLAALARGAGCSAAYLQRAFVQVLGLSPREYGAALKLARFKAGLRSGRTIADATFDAGFGSSSRIYEQAARALGMTPAQYRRGGAGLELVFATAPCPLGFVLVAGTLRGISAVTLGDSAGALIERLRSEFPAAVIREDHDALRDSVDAVLRHLGGEPSATRDLRLDVRATAFERRVWSALQQIPPGSRATYAEVATMMGAPGAARAVARVCATNRLAIVVPCHRVVPAAGGVGQYRWGAGRKAGLLDAERRVEVPAPRAGGSTARKGWTARK